MNFAAAADELRRQEYTRLAAAVTPRLEALRSITAAALREEIVTMWDGLGHTVITTPSAPEIVTVKGDRKFITLCADPIEPAPARTASLRRLHQRVVAAGAERGFYVSVRGFSAEARLYAESAPVQLIDGPEFVRAMHRSRKGRLLPQTYRAMCRQCGDVVQHRLGNDEAKRCGNDHFVAPTIARAELVKPSQPPSAQPATLTPANILTVVKQRNNSPKAQRLRKIRTHNLQRNARTIKQQRGG